MQQREDEYTNIVPTQSEILPDNAYHTETDLESSLAGEEERGAMSSDGTFEESSPYIVLERLIGPLVYSWQALNFKLYSLTERLGHPLLFGRFIYLAIVGSLMWFILNTANFPDGAATGSSSYFSNITLLGDHSRKLVDLNQFEVDLEYLCRFPHMSGTQGDVAIRDYVRDRFIKSGLDDVYEHNYVAYSTYPSNGSTLVVFSGGEKKLEIALDERNFLPLSRPGVLTNVDIIYAHHGMDDELRQLRKAGILREDTRDYVLLLRYTDKFMVSEQIMTAQKYNAAGIIYISDAYGEDKDVIQVKSVGLPQFGTGDVLSPGWTGTSLNYLPTNESKALPSIPTIVLSYNQGQILLSKLSNAGLPYEDGHFSGLLNFAKVDLKVDVAIRERQPVFNVLGKFEGREQPNKAIVIGAARTAASNGGSGGAMYPNFGTASLLALVDVFQELRYRYNWKPLRTVYFLSVGGDEYNFAGATEGFEMDALNIEQEVYSYLDISQLGLTKLLDIEAHPLLSHLFTKNPFAEQVRSFDVAVGDIHHYGNWIPYTAHGIPVAVLASKYVKARWLPIGSHLDEFKLIHEILEQEKDLHYQENLRDVLEYVVRITLRLVDEPLIPFDVEGYVLKIQSCLHYMLKIYKQKLEFDAIVKSLLKWRKIGQLWLHFIPAWDESIASEIAGSSKETAISNRWNWNVMLSGLSKQTTYEFGLPNRNFYKDVLFGPPVWTERFYHSRDINPWSFPGVKDAISNRDWALAQRQIEIIGKLLDISAEANIQMLEDFRATLYSK